MFNPCSGNEALMYFYLLHQCNLRRWINPFEFKTRDLELMLGFSRATISAIRDKLKERGLIDFEKGVGSGNAAYLICGLEVTDKELVKRFCVHPLNTKLNTNLNTKLNTNANPTLYREDINKDIHPNGCIVRVREPGCFDEEFEKEDKKRLKKTRNPPPPFPTLDEVKEHFLLHGADRRVKDWEICAQQFYDYFAAVDWKDRAGRRITRWDCRANTWIFDEEKRQKEEAAIAKNKINHHEIENDKFSGRRGTEPSTQSRKGFKAL